MDPLTFEMSNKIGTKTETSFVSARGTFPEFLVDGAGELWGKSQNTRERWTATSGGGKESYRIILPCQFMTGTDEECISYKHTLSKVFENRLKLDTKPIFWSSLPLILWHHANLSDLLPAVR